MGMKGFKGFEKDFSCRGKQYEENTTYEEHGVGCYHKGVMHFYEDPWAVLDYYPLVNENGDISEFAEVEALGQVWDDCNKRATNKLHIGAKLGLKGFLKACIDFTLEKTKIENFRSVSSGYATQIGTSGDATQIGTSGDDTQIGTSGYATKIGTSGYATQIGTSGDATKIGTSGYATQIGTSGDATQIGTSGDRTKIGTSGYATQIGTSGDATKIGTSGYATKIGTSGYATKIGTSGDATKIGTSGDATKIGTSGYATQIGTSGDATQIGTSGDRTKINSTGKNTVIVCAGHGCIAKAKKGSWITLSEWEKNFVEKRYIPVCVKTEYVDGEKIKEDTYYTLENGEFVEV